MYYSDPGDLKAQKKSRKKDDNKSEAQSNKNTQGYYSEPDAKYFEIDYQFLKELSKLAKININYRNRTRAKKNEKIKLDKNDYDIYEKLVDDRLIKKKTSTKRRIRSSKYRYDQHCQICCSICNILDKNKSKVCDCKARRVDAYTQQQAAYEIRSKAIDKNIVSTRRGSVHSVKSVSFIDDKDILKSPTNYTGKSFTNDLKQFLLKPSASRFSLREKLFTGFRTSEDKYKVRQKRSPSIGLIKGLWKSL